MIKLLFSLILIALGLLAGYLWQIRMRKSYADPDSKILIYRKSLQKIGLLVFMPISFAAAVWVVSLSNVKLAFLPLLGASALLLGGIFGIILAKLLKKDGKATGSLFCCGSFTNIGSIGALIAFVFLGEQGFGLIALYKMFEEMSYYTVGFPIARYFSGESENTTFKNRLLEVLGDPFVRAALFAFTIGICLNFSPLSRPLFFESLNAFLVPAGTFILLVSIGLGMRFSSVADYYVEGLSVAFIKFLLVPAITVTIAYLLGFHLVENGLPLKVVLIASSMPVAFTALVAASIYDLDLDLANSCWLITTSALCLILPILAFLLEHI